MNGSAEPLTWTDAYTRACRRHPELVSVHEGPHGQLAVLLRPGLLPTSSDRELRLREFQAIGARIISELKTEGVRAPITLLQLRPPGEVAHILDCWTCRYDADPALRAKLTRAAGRRVEYTRFAITRRGLLQAPLSTETRPPRSEGTRLPMPMTRWYSDMASCWLTIEPLVRRRLTLRAHQWLAKSVFTDHGIRPDVLADLGPGGRLASALTEQVPAAELERWRPWIQLVLLDLRRALRWPPAHRTAAWCRWLFLIPYGAPVPRPRGPAAAVSRDGEP
jgi:hypothetical protein